jgi:hypothetical protein
MMVGEISDYFGQAYNETISATVSSDTYGKYAACTAFTQMQREQIGALENVHIVPNGTLPTWDHHQDNAHWDTHSALWIGQKVGIMFMNEYLDTDYVVSDEDLVAEITLGGEVIGRYDSLVGALNEAPDGAIVELKKDLTLYSTLVIGNRNKITLNGNDHHINFVLGESDNQTSMMIFYATDITVNNLHIAQNNNAWGTQQRLGAKVTWNGGSITSNNFAFVINYTDVELTVNGGKFNVTAGTLDYSAVIFVGQYNAKVTVTDGTFNAAGLAVGIRVSNYTIVTVTGGEWTVEGDYVFEMLGTESTLVLDKDNVTMNETYAIAPVYNAGYGHVEDDAVTDPFED